MSLWLIGHAVDASRGVKWDGRFVAWYGALTKVTQYGGSPVKVGEEEYHLFRDSE